MQTVPNTPLIINIGIISQYLAIRDIRSRHFASNQLPYREIAQHIRSVRKSVQWAYSYNSSDSTLVATGEYLYALCAPYSQQAISILNNSTAQAPTVTGPSNDSVLVGASASFTIVVTSSISYTVQWYRNGVIIPGANSLTYTLMNAQLTDSGSTFDAVITNSAGAVTSPVATLTVTAGLVASYYYGAIDYSNSINAGNDNVPYVGTFPITSGQPLSFTWPSGAANQFIVIRYPATETTKTTYANPPTNNGVIPGLAFDNIKTIGSYKYIFSRNGNPFAQDTANPLTFS